MVDLLDFLVIVFAIMFILLILMFILARPRIKVKFKTLDEFLSTNFKVKEKN